MSAHTFEPMRIFLDEQLNALREQGLYKNEEALTTAQAAHIGVEDGREVLNLCANNYLGLADSPQLIGAAKTAMDEWGFGMSSVRFICGTQTQHTALEAALTSFLHPRDAASSASDDAWDTILYSSCFDANGGLFETLFGAEDAIISDELNHASIIDGVRLSKAARFRYKNRDMADLEEKLQEATASARFTVIATDGVFSMDGYLAPLPEICDLAEKYGALVMVDDSHAVGFMGETGAGTPEYFGVSDRIDILTGTLGKALGGASGGYTCARREIVATLRQKSRPYLFSNSLAPAITGATLKVIELLKGSSELLVRLRENTEYFRKRMGEEGFEIPQSTHPIVPVMFGDAVVAAKMADAILARGVYVRAFSYPVVPMGKARIRTQLNAKLTREDLDRAIAAFVDARREVLGN
ncbi:glycine C-acetyltransferase [Arcanobacterium pluranimalium]|uniref:glycine C-acetyltransferase n=1 Tax=Arcanobacterium pluranimalium TaxID=108028 RepID=UPI00195E5C5E|nr:glycine C-acetyltransferase [Arcanobacterium pluranimalium]MBM7824186.1 glycine C-acetyltransferase [Arcanobacterium pluranimalium]